MSQPDQPWIIEVTEADFQAQVMDRSRQTPVVVDFWAPWCGPCRQLGPVLEALADEYQGRFVLAKVNADEAQALCQSFGVQGIPSVFAVVDGQIANQFTGAQPEAAVRQFVESVVPGGADAPADDARQLEATDPAAAAAAYEKALADDPENAEAALGLARLALAQGDLARAHEMVGRVPVGTEDEVEGLRARVAFARQAPEWGDVDACRVRAEADPDDLAARFDLGRALAAAGRYEDALAVLLAIVQADKTFGGAAVKETMVAIFRIVGSRSELADAYRDKLALALY